MKARALEREPLLPAMRLSVDCLLSRFLRLQRKQTHLGVHKPRHVQAKEAIKHPVAHV